MFDEIFGKFNSGPNRGGSNAIDDFAKILEEKNAEIKRLKELINTRRERILFWTGRRSVWRTIVTTGNKRSHSKGNNRKNQFSHNVYSLNNW